MEDLWLLDRMVSALDTNQEDGGEIAVMRDAKTVHSICKGEIPAPGHPVYWWNELATEILLRILCKYRMTKAGKKDMQQILKSFPLGFRVLDWPSNAKTGTYIRNVGR